MRRLIGSVFAVLFVLTAVHPAESADFGFGIPDMVEEKVDELDQEVREFKANQPFLEDFRGVTLRASPDTRDVITSSAVTSGGLTNRVFVTLSANQDNERVMALFQADGEGKLLSNLDIVQSNDVGPPTFEQLSVSPSDKFVDVLYNIPTDSGPQGVFFRRQTDDDMTAVPGTGKIVIGSTFSEAASVDTAVEVNTFSYDDTQSDIYLSGDSGVFKVLGSFSSPGGGERKVFSEWNSKYQGKFRVPEDNLVIKGDSIYVTALEPFGGGNTKISLKKIGADSELIQTDTIALNVSNPKTDLIGGQDYLFLHYYDGSDDYLVKRTYEDITNGKSQTFSLSSSFRLKIEGENNLFAEGTDGKIFSFGKDPLSFKGDIKVSDTRPRLGFQAQSGDLLVGVRESSDRSPVLAVEEDLSDSRAVFPSPSQVIDPIRCQPNVVADRPAFTRPVWLKRGFLGVVFSGACISWRDDFINSPNLSNTGWPHEEGNNQRQRKPQN